LPQKGGEMYLLWSYQISAAWYVGCSNANLQLGKWCNAPKCSVYDIFHSTLKAMSVVLHFGVVLFLYVKDRDTDSGLFKFQAWIQGATSECAHNMLQPSNFSELFKLIVTGVVSLSIRIRISCHHTIVGLLCITVVIQKLAHFPAPGNHWPCQCICVWICFLLHCVGLRLSIARHLQWHRFWKSSNLSASNQLPAISLLNVFVLLLVPKRSSQSSPFCVSFLF
jgi:hypothetical protein